MQFATAMLGKPVLHNPERDIVKVARSLLAACGHPAQVDRLREDAAVLGPLSTFARSLCPADDQAVAQATLLDAQRHMLEDKAYATIGTGLPVTFLPPQSTLPAVAKKFARATFRKLTSDA